MNGVIILRINLSKGWLRQNNSPHNDLIAESAANTVQCTVKLVHFFSALLIAKQIELHRGTVHAESRATDTHAPQRQKPDISSKKEFIGSLLDQFLADFA